MNKRKHILNQMVEVRANTKTVKKSLETVDSEFSSAFIQHIKYSSEIDGLLLLLFNKRGDISDDDILEEIMNIHEKDTELVNTLNTLDKQRLEVRNEYYGKFADYESLIRELRTCWKESEYGESVHEIDDGFIRGQ